MTIDSTDCKTDLCNLGVNFYCDKSPYNTVAHRHPYTPVYAMLFSRFRYLPVRFAEIGVAGGASIFMWRHYFLHVETRIYGFDRDENFLKNLMDKQLPFVSTETMDVFHDESIRHGLEKIGGNLDILLDDSIHGAPEQIKIVRNAIPYIKSGGMIVIEDIHRNIPNEVFEKGLEDVLDQFSFVSFILTEHKDRWSPGWDNDKLLVLIKK